MTLPGARGRPAAKLAVAATAASRRQGPKVQAPHQRRAFCAFSRRVIASTARCLRAVLIAELFSRNSIILIVFFAIFLFSRFS